MTEKELLQHCMYDEYEYRKEENRLINNFDYMYDTQIKQKVDIVIKEINDIINICHKYEHTECKNLLVGMLNKIDNLKDMNEKSL